MKAKTTKTTKSTKAVTTSPKTDSIQSLKSKLVEIRLSIKAHQEKNTNAHKSLKKQIAQLLTKKNK